MQPPQSFMIQNSVLRVCADAVGIEVIALAADGLCGVGEHRAGGVKVIPLVVPLQPSGQHVSA